VCGERLKVLREKEKADKAAEHQRQKEETESTRLYNYPKRRRGKPQDQPHQRINARDVWVMPHSLIKLGVHYLLHPPRLQHVAATLSFHRNIDSKN
jgi:hypothetical protein